MNQPVQPNQPSVPQEQMEGRAFTSAGVANPDGASAFNVFQFLGPAIEIAMALGQAASGIQSGQPVTSPPIRTYIAGKHVELTVNINPLP